MIVRELLTRLGFRVDNAGIQQYETRLNKVKQSAQGAADAVRGMVAGFLGFNALQSLAKTADTMQSLQARISMLPQTIMEAGDAFDTVAARATATRQSIEGYSTLYLKLMNGGKAFIKTQEDGLRLADTVSKALVVGGATTAEQNSAILQFGQAIGSGVLQGDELRSMAESAPQFMDKLAEAIGVPREELKKFASEGKLTTKLVLEGVEKMGPAFDEMFKKMPMTIGQSTQIIGNRWAVFVNRMNRESHAVTFIAATFLKTFDLIEAGLAKMVNFFGGATQTIKFFGTLLAAALAPLLFKGLVGTIALLLSPLGALVAVLTVAGLAIEDFLGWMDGAPSLFGRFFGSFEDHRHKFVEAWQAIQDTFTRVVQLFNTGMQELQLWMGGGPSMFTEFFGPFAPLAATFMEVWNKLKAGVGIVLDDLAFGFQRVKQVFDESMKNGLLADIGSFIAIALPLLGQFAKYVYDFIPFKFIYESFKEFFSQLLNAIGGALNVFAGIIKTIYGLITLDGSTAIEGQKQMWLGLHEFFKGLAKALIASIGLIFSGIGGLLTTQLDSAKAKLTEFKNWALSFLPSGLFSGTNAQAGAIRIPSMVNPARVSPATAAGAATAAGGVPNAGTGNVVNIHQTLPPGTTPETAKAAKGATEKAAKASGLDKPARQLQQAQ